MLILILQFMEWLSDRQAAEIFKWHDQSAQLALVNGAVGAVYAPGGQFRGVFSFKIRGMKIIEIDVLGDAVRLRRLEIAILDY